MGLFLASAILGGSLSSLSLQAEDWSLEHPGLPEVSGVTRASSPKSSLMPRTTRDASLAIDASHTRATPVVTGCRGPRTRPERSSTASS